MILEALFKGAYKRQTCCLAFSIADKHDCHTFEILRRPTVSLFEDDQYQYCDTFFVYFETQNRPSLADIEKALSSGGETCELTDAKSEPDGAFKSITVRSPHDSSAMDIAFVGGEEVVEQVEELVLEFRQISLEGEEFDKLDRIRKANARLDVFQFERVSESQEPDMIDPGGLFLVIEKLKRVCDGVGLDPQSKTLL